MEGRRLGPYRIVAYLGGGATAGVWAAEVVDPVPGLAPGARVALKVLHPHIRREPIALERFHREAEVLQRIRHPNVVAFYEAGEAAVDGEPRIYLATEFVNGRTLRHLVHEEGPQDEAVCLQIAREIAAGLTAVHAAGAVHRDLKPENLIVTSRPVAVKIMDLGSARLRDATVDMTQPQAFVGTFLYAAPEQIPYPGRREGQVGPATDLYALGWVLYELLTGVHPWRGEALGDLLILQLTRLPDPPSRLRPEISPFVERVVLTLLAKDPAARFPDAATLLAVLEAGTESPWWNVQRPLAAAGGRRGRPRPRVARDAPLQGREEALGLLLRAWGDACAGRGRVALIVGEAGIGKSRLVDELIARVEAAGEGGAALFGACPPGGAATATGAFCSALREHLGPEDLERAVAARLGDAAAVVGPFAALLRGEPPPPGSTPLETDTVLASFVRLVQGLAAERPLLLAIDDLPLAPEEGRTLFAALARAVPGQRVLLVGTARPELPPGFLAELQALEHVVRLDLDRLGLPQVQGLAASALADEQAGAVVGPSLARASDGNPFLALAILRGWTDSGVLARAAGGPWEVRGRLEDAAAPMIVRDIIRARVVRIGDPERELLDLAAVCGHEFDPLLVADALGRERIPVLRSLVALERTHRLVRSHGRTYAFDHHQVHDVLYAELGPALREEYHALVGGILTRRLDGGGDAAPRAGDTAFLACDHLLRADRGGAALPYLDRALEHLEANYLSQSALDLMGRVLAVPGLLVGRRRVEVLLRLATVSDLVGRRTVEAAALDEAILLAEAEHDTRLLARALVLQGARLRTQGRSEDAERTLRRALALVREAADEALEGDLEGLLGSVLARQGRHAEALDCHRRQRAIAGRTGNLDAQGRAEGSLAYVLHRQGDAAGALAAFRESLRLFEQTSSRHNVARALNNLGSILNQTGRLEEADRCFERALALAREIGARASEARALGNLGAVRSCLGRHAEGLAFARQDLALQRAMGDRYHELLALQNGAGACHALAMHAQARAGYEEARALSVAIRAREETVAALRGLAEVELDAPRPEAARALLEECRRLTAAGGDASELAGVVVDQIEAELEVGDPQRAHALAREIPAEAGFAPELAVAVATARVRVGLAPVEEAEASYLAVREGLSVGRRIDLSFALWSAGGSEARRREARELAVQVLALAPPERREPMRTNLRWLRRVLAATGEEERADGDGSALTNDPARGGA